MQHDFKLERFPGTLIVLCCLSLLLSDCTKPKVHYLRPLPPSTFESRELFECRVNGRYFRARATDSASLGSTTYFTAYSGEQGFRFEITANMHESSCVFSSITIHLDSIELKQGRSYILGTPGPKKNHATYFYVSGCSQDGKRLFTSDDLFSEVFITRVDFRKKVVLGTFDFRMKDSTGREVRFADGFFDRHFRH